MAFSSSITAMSRGMTQLNSKYQLKIEARVASVAVQSILSVKQKWSSNNYLLLNPLAIDPIVINISRMIKLNTSSLAKRFSVSDYLKLYEPRFCISLVSFPVQTTSTINSPEFLTTDPLGINCMLFNSSDYDACSTLSQLN